MGRLQDNQYSTPSSFQRKKQNNQRVKEDRARNEAKLQVKIIINISP